MKFSQFLGIQRFIRRRIKRIYFLHNFFITYKIICCILDTLPQLFFIIYRFILNRIKKIHPELSLKNVVTNLQVCHYLHLSICVGWFRWWRSFNGKCGEAPLCINRISIWSWRDTSSNKYGNVDYTNKCLLLIFVEAWQDQKKN